MCMGKDTYCSYYIMQRNYMYKLGCNSAIIFFNLADDDDLNRWSFDTRKIKVKNDTFGKWFKCQSFELHYFVYVFILWSVVWRIVFDLRSEGLEFEPGCQWTSRRSIFKDRLESI